MNIPQENLKTAIGRNPFSFHISRGHVIENSQWSTTHVSANGPYANSIGSTTTTYDQIWIRDASGREIKATISDCNFPYRVGHEVTLISGEPDHSKESFALLLYNHTMNQYCIPDSALKLAADKSHTWFTNAGIRWVVASCMMGILHALFFFRPNFQGTGYISDFFCSMLVGSLVAAPYFALSAAVKNACRGRAIKKHLTEKILPYLSGAQELSVQAQTSASGLAPAH